jgi:hypothetical protein
MSTFKTRWSMVALKITSAKATIIKTSSIMVSIDMVLI